MKGMKKPKLKPKKEISGGQMRREYAKMKKEIASIRERENRNFQILFNLAVQLYIIYPGHPIFSNNTLNEEFLEIIKKQATSQIETAKKNQQKKKDNKKENDLNSAEATPVVEDEAQDEKYPEK